MKPHDYYSRYDHFLQLNLTKVGSFRTIAFWLKEYQKIIDVGCGVGHLTNYWKATGIDKDNKGIELARKNFPNTKFIHSDISKTLPFASSSIEVIVCYNVLEHLDNQAREKFFTEAKRILRKNGIIIAGYIDEDFWLNRLLASLFKDYGLNDSTHLVSWKIPDFKEEISRHFQIIKSKKTSPYGKFTFLTKFLKGEMLLFAKVK